MASSPGTGALDRARAKAYVRLLPILLASYVIAYVDRVNVGFAKLTMQPDLEPLGFSESAFGFGMGIFFVGYLVLEIPGTLLVERWSARKWISRIMISWGIVAALTAFVHYRVPGVTWLAELTVRWSGQSLRAAGQFQSGLALPRSHRRSSLRCVRPAARSSCSSSRCDSCSGWPKRDSIPA